MSQPVVSVRKWHNSFIMNSICMLRNIKIINGRACNVETNASYTLNSSIISMFFENEFVTGDQWECFILVSRCIDEISVCTPLFGMVTIEINYITLETYKTNTTHAHGHSIVVALKPLFKFLWRKKKQIQNERCIQADCMRVIYVEEMCSKSIIENTELLMFPAELNRKNTEHVNSPSRRHFHDNIP